MEKKKKTILYVILYLSAALIGFATYYFGLPPINAQSVSFWLFLAWLCVLGIAPYYIIKLSEKNPDTPVRELFTKMFNIHTFGTKRRRKNKSNDVIIEDKTTEKKRLRPSSFLHFIPLVPVLVILIGMISSAEIFNASLYSSVIEVKDAEFATDMPETDKITHIALMDTDTAKIIGNRTLGSLSHVVSQYEVSEEYSQINYLGRPKKVSNLEYAGFFKWLGNRASGIPGYVMVDPVDNTAKYVELENPLIYVESGFFGDDLMRKLRFDYPTKILGTPSFEIDDDGRAVFIVPCFRPKVSLFGAEDVDEVIIFDPATGGIKKIDKDL